MRTRLTIIVLLLVVLPTAVLSLLAGRAFQAWELVLQDQLETSASVAIQTIWKQLRSQLDDDLDQVNTVMSGSLSRSGRYDDAESSAKRVSESYPLVKCVYIFINPWGFLYPQEESDSLRPGWDLPPGAGGEPNGHRGALVDALRKAIASGGSDGDRVRFAVNETPYCFSRVDRKRDLYVGCEVNAAEFRRLVTKAVSGGAGAGFVLRVEGVGYSGAEAGDVVVTDSFSTGPSFPISTAEGADVPVLASGNLFTPFNSVRIVAVAQDPEELRRMGAFHARLYVWGVLLLAIGIIVGAGFVLREAVSEIKLAGAKSDFAIGVSHDLRTPVASMKVLAESLYLDHVPDKDKQKKFLGMIVKECDRLSQLIERVLFLVRFGQDALIYRPVNLDVGDLVTAAVSAFNTRGGMNVDVKIDPDLPSVMVDKSAMTQVVLNLLDNAEKYGKGKAEEGSAKEIEIMVSVDGRMVEVVVRDHGRGIEKRELKKIFKKFYRAPGAYDGNTSGVGLGLAMCKRIVVAHGGRIEVESEVGVGTMFSVSLPIVV
ncbi:MAG: HAMP domain-containing histidine kinase [Kiritimatiellae bacterium]|nr:HAMP domain-containing histidine kinase [Kiritimatiellia bacterium]